MKTIDYINAYKEVIFNLIFAYENKDADNPHKFEYDAIKAGMSELTNKEQLKFCKSVLDKMEFDPLKAIQSISEGEKYPEVENYLLHQRNLK